VLYRLTRDAKQVLSGLAEPAVDATADAAVDGDLAVAAARAA
jgi:hypothetical protein